MASSQHLIPSFSSPTTASHDSTRSHLFSSSLWASPITISSFSSTPKLSPLLQTRRRLRLRVTAMAPPKPGGKAKKVVGMIKLALEAGKATPAPPVGPALGSKGVNIMAFCKDYNARTADKAGYIIPVEITVYDVELNCLMESKMRNILEVLMESTPREIDATKLEKGLCEMDEVLAVHELHIWAITVGKVLLACHVIARPDADTNMVLEKVIDYIKREYNITHVTIQIERQ